MLDWNSVIKYVRLHLGLPSGFIEKSEADMIEYIKEYTLREFSDYYPDVNYVSIITNNNTYIHPTKPRHYYIKEPENLDILGVVDVYFPEGSMLFLGHPPIGPISFNGMKWFSLNSFKARFVHEYTDWNYDWQFVPPNLIRIGQDMQPDGYVAVKYERKQPDDLRKIPPSMHRDFLDLCLCDMKIWIGSIRSLYTGTSTPYGELPLNGETLKQEGFDRKREVLEKIEAYRIPGFFVDVG